MKDITTAVSNRMAIADIKKRYDTGEISRNAAKELAQPILDKVNLRSAEIAKKHGNKSYPRLNFINAMRNSY